MKEFNIDMMKKLNDEFCKMQILPGYKDRNEDFKIEQAQQRVKYLNSIVDLTEKKVLEIGCGAGYISHSLTKMFDCNVSAVDIEFFDSWNEYENDKLKFYDIDLTRKNPFANKQFDVVISYFTWEHLLNPIEMIKVVKDLLKDNGILYLSVMPYRSPLGSHLYRDIYFPYPQLLFDDDTIIEFAKQCGVKKEFIDKFFFLNKMTYAEYKECFNLFELKIINEFRKFKNVDDKFLNRFKEKLSIYPRFDLDLEFFSFTLRNEKVCEDRIYCSEIIMKTNDNNKNIIKFSVIATGDKHLEYEWHVYFEDNECDVYNNGKSEIYIKIQKSGIYMVNLNVKNSTGIKIENSAEFWVIGS